MQANKRLNIVIWAFPSWNGDYLKSTVELAKELAVHHNILYIDYAYTIKDVLASTANSTLPVRQILNGSESLKRVKLESGGVISVLSLPPIVPFNWTGSKTIYKIIERVNYSLVSRRIRKAITSLNFNADIVVNAFNPFFANAIPKIFPGLPVIYYCYDNIDAAAWASRHGARLEGEMAENITAAVFSSDALKQNKAWEIPAYVVRNGVDLRNFNKVAVPPANYKNSAAKRKVIGYVGSIDDRLDFTLLEKLVMANPHYDFYFVGRIITDRAQVLKSFPNVTFTGAVAPERLPAAMIHFDAGIIPFVKNDFTKNIYPMKVNEYLALGIPVVATGFARFNDLSGLLEVADDAIAFSAKLNEAINANSEGKRRERKLTAYGNSWENKASEFHNIILQYAVR